MISFAKRYLRSHRFAPISASTEFLRNELDSRHWLWVLGSVCAVHRTAFNASLIAKQFPPPHSIASLLEALHALGLEVRTQNLGNPALADTEFPAIAWLRPATQAEPVTGGEMEPILLVKSGGGRLLYFRAGSQTPETIALDEAPALFSETYFTVRKLAPNVPDEGGGSETVMAQPFGFRWFVPELLKHKRIWRDVLLASLAVQVLALATPLFTQVIIDKVIVHHTQSTLIAVGFGLAMFLIFSAALSWVRQYLVLHTGNRIDAVLGSQVFSHLLRLPMPYFEQRPTGVVISRLHAVETIREFLSGAAISLLLDLPFLLIFLAIMFAYSWQLSLIAVAGLGLVSILSLAVTPAFRSRLNHQFLVGARNQAFVTEYVSGMATVKSLQMEPTVERKYGELLARFLQAGFRTKTLANTYNTLANALEQTMTVAILLVGALIVMQSDGFTVGMLVAFQMFASRLSQPLLRLVGLWQELQQAAIAVKRLGDVMNAPQEPYSVIPAREHKGRGRIDLEGVSFRYGEDRPYLYRDMNLSIAPGQCIALMGPSGSGKSTLAKLLQGFVWAQEGSIRIDGHDTRHLSANELRDYFGVVPQETVLFSGTLYENLQLANPQASFEDLVQACKFAEIHAFIESLPQGYQTQIGEHGVGLSGGQRQRVAIARALLKRPKILIFDEATSGLDEDTAQQLAQTINTLKGQVTLIFVAHRLPTGLQVDRVVEIRIRSEESGTSKAERGGLKTGNAA